MTYIIQRAESLAGSSACWPCTCVVRGALSERPRPFDSAQGAPRLCSGRWYVAAFAACALGMGTKQTVATAPLVIFLYDWIFLSGSFLETLRRRWALYLALAVTWLLLILSLVAGPDAACPRASRCRHHSGGLCP